MRVAVLTFAALLLVAAPALARSGPVQLGTALNSTGFGSGDAAYRQAVSRYGAVTAESAMKLDALQPARGSSSFGEADRMVDWREGAGSPCTATR